MQESKSQHACNVALFERALDGTGVAAQLNITIEDTLWALSHVRSFEPVLAASSIHRQACDRLQESARLRRSLHCSVVAGHLHVAVVNAL